ncbi:hypothetical protein CEXT_28621 [Caerostris extrusa]|uniref:Uncharacterized protein n=1 Tax=Caerostris extrusa TaxID=172846 RepID=A0AAV4TZN5_CAEEX|nr:hypothetical protein CEXT_28621 [Caerostris extrusa]
MIRMPPCQRALLALPSDCQLNGQEFISVRKQSNGTICDEVSTQTVFFTIADEKMRKIHENHSRGHFICGIEFYSDSQDPIGQSALKEGKLRPVKITRRCFLCVRENVTH